MVLVEVETAHWTFKAFGFSETHARAALAAGWARHCEQTGADVGHVDPATEGNVWTFQPGECYRDDARIAG